MVTVFKHLRDCAGLLHLAVLQFLKDVPLQQGGGGCLGDHPGTGCSSQVGGQKAFDIQPELLF